MWGETSVSDWQHAFWWLWLFTVSFLSTGTLHRHSTSEVRLQPHDGSQLSETTGPRHLSCQCPLSGGVIPFLHVLHPASECVGRDRISAKPSEVQRQYHEHQMGSSRPDSLCFENTKAPRTVSPHTVPKPLQQYAGLGHNNVPEKSSPKCEHGQTHRSQPGRLRRRGPYPRLRRRGYLASPRISSSMPQSSHSRDQSALDSVTRVSSTPGLMGPDSVMCKSF